MEKIIRYPKIVFYAFTVILIGIIHFYIYDHFWFLKLLGLNIYSPKINYVFILPFFCIAIVYQMIISIKNNQLENISKTNRDLALWAFLYFITCIFVVILHEADSDFLTMIKYSFYLSIPIVLSLSVFAIFRDNIKIKKAVFILFLVGIVFSVYATVLRTKIITDISASYNVFSFNGKTWVSSGTGEYLSRFSIPGLGPTNFPSMLVPLIFVGIYLFRSCNNKMRYVYLESTLFLFSNMIITQTRGAFISLSTGMLYLFMKGWFKCKKSFLVFLIVVQIMLIFIMSGQGLLTRLSLTGLQFISSSAKGASLVAFEEKAQHEGLGIDDIVEEKNRGLLFKHAIQHVNPIFGIGFSGISSHIMYVDVLTIGGIALFMPLIFFLFSVFYQNHKEISNNKDAFPKDLGIVLMAISLSYIVDQMWMPAFVNNYWIWFGFAAAWARNCEMGYRAPAKLSGAEAI